MGSLYTVLAPTLTTALNWTHDMDNVFRFRNLYRYFVPKFFSEKLYGNGAMKHNIPEEFKLAEFIDELQTEPGQLKNVQFVSYRANASANLLRGYNVYYDLNYITQLVLDNPKDHRPLYKKMDDVVSMLTVGLHGSLHQYQLAGYKDKTIIIPVNLWTSEMKNLSIFRKTTKDEFGAFIQAIGNDEGFKNLFHDYRVVLVNINELMILDPLLIPDDSKGDFIKSNITTFLRRCKSTDTAVATEADTEEEAAELKQVENLSKKQNTTTKVLNKITPDNVSISKDTAQKVQKAVEIAAQAKKENTEPVVYMSQEVDVSPTDEPVEDETKEVSTPADIITQARLSGQSIANYQRNEMLKKRYKELTIDNRPIEEVIKSEEKYVIPKKTVPANTINPAYKELTSYNFEKAYNDQLFMHDLARILIHFSKADPPLYLLDDPKIVDISNDIDKLYMVYVEYEDENRKRHKFHFKLPKMYQDKYLFLNEQKWNIVHQKFPFPVNKISPDSGQIVTNYNKIMLQRYGTNISAKITKLRKVIEGPDCPRGVKGSRGDNTQFNKTYLTTIEYDEFARKFTSLKIDNLTLYFSITDAKAVIPPAPKTINDNTVYPLAGDRRSGRYYYLSGSTNIVYDQDGKEHGELSDWIIDTISEKHKDFKDIFDDTSAGTKFTYTRGKILGAWLPLILIASAANPDGLVGVLNAGKINYQFVESRPRDIDTNNQGVFAFSDGYLIFDRYPYENSLLLNGLSVLPSKTYSFYDMGNRDTYVEIFDTLYDRRNLYDGIKSFYSLLIDPITEDVLTHLGMPTDFTKLLLYANGVMADNSYNLDSDYEQSRIRSNEIVLAKLYDILAHEAYVSFLNGDKFSIREDALIKSLLQERIVDSHSKLNIALELENDNQVKLKGPHGMNEERSFTLEKRAYHPSMRGLIGMNSTYSAEVGINRHMVLNSNIVDARGFVDVNKKDYDGTELETPGELLNPFDVESSDPDRVSMAISQSKHYVPTQSTSYPLVNFDMERVAPYMSSDYTAVSKKAGIVKEISNDIMIIQYEDGTYEDVDLSSHPDKNTDGGFFIMNNMITDFKVGDKFEANTILAYNPKYISEKDEFGDNLTTAGTLARVAIVSNGAVFEDATYITDELAEKMATYITVDKTVHLSRFSNIKKIVKKGQQIQANDALLYFDDTDDQFSSQMLQQMADESEDDDEISATAAPVFCKVTGVVKDIKIYYTCDIDLMSPSLQKLIKSYNSEVSKRHKVIEKYMDPKNAQSIIPPCEQVKPDSTGRVKGKKMPKEVMIEFYIEYKDKVKLGDKENNMYALKGVVSNIIPKGQEAFTEFNPERKIDSYLSAIGMFKRMVFSLVKEGCLTKVLIEKKRLLRNKYLDKLKKELEK